MLPRTSIYWLSYSIYISIMTVVDVLSQNINLIIKFLKHYVTQTRLFVIPQVVIEISDHA